MIKSLWKIVAGTLYPKVSTWIVQSVKFIAKGTTSDGTTNLYEGKDSGNNIVFAVKSNGVVTGTFTTTTTILAPVISRLATPPVSPVEGDRYLVIATGSGAWVGKEDKIAQWTSGAWVYTTPVTNNTVYVTNTLTTYRYTGSAWQAYAGTAIMQNGNALGLKMSIGTNDNNPVAIKTNNVDVITILSNGNLGVNTSSPITKMTVLDTVSTSPRGIMSFQVSTDIQGARLHTRKTRGTEALPTTIVTGDYLGRWVGSGYIGETNTYKEAVSIDFRSTGTINDTGTGRLPTKIVFNTCADSDSSLLTEVVNITSTGMTVVGTTNSNSFIASSNIQNNLYLPNGGVDVKLSTFGNRYGVASALYANNGTIPMVYAKYINASTYYIGIGTTMPTTALDLLGTSAQIIQVSRNTANNTAGNNFTIQAGGSTVNGAISSLVSAPTNGGSGYAVGDILTIGVSGGATCIVQSVNNGVVTAVQLITEGYNYTIGTKATIGGSGDGLCTVNITSVRVGATDKTGGDLLLRSGISTGTGTSNIRFYTSPTGSTGTTDNTQTETMTILGSGFVGINNAVPTVALDVLGTINGTNIGASNTMQSSYFIPRSQIDVSLSGRSTQKGSNASLSGNLGAFPVVSGRYIKEGVWYVGLNTLRATAALDINGVAARVIQVQRNTIDNTAGNNLSISAGGATVQGAISTITGIPINGGTSGTYAAGDILTLASGNNDATVVVQTVNAGVVTNVILINEGSGYSINTVATNGGGGSGCTISITSIRTGATDKNGGVLYLTPGISTGTAMSSVRMKRNSRAATTGTTDNTQSDALVIPSEFNLVNNGNNSLFTISLTTLNGTGGTINFTINLTDGTDIQTYTEVVKYSAVNKGGVYTSAITELGTPSKSLSAGTLTTAWSFITGTNLLTVVLTPASSLTPTSMKISYTINNNSPSTITQL